MMTDMSRRDEAGKVALPRNQLRSSNATETMHVFMGNGAIAIVLFYALIKTWADI